MYPPQKKSKIWILVVFIVVVIGVVIWTAVNAGLMATSLLDGRDRLFEAKGAIETLDFAGAEVSLDQAEVDFDQAGKHLRRISWLKVLPWIGPQVKAADEVFKISSNLFEIVDKISGLGSELTRLASEASDTASAIAPLRYDELSPTTKRILLQRLNGAAPDLALMAEQTKLVKEELKDFSDVPEPMGLIIRKLEGFLDEAYSTLTLASTAARIIPAFTGLGQEKTFLLLLENNAELRPAGGFIGAYGILKIEDGEIKELTLKDSYLLDSAADPYYFAVPPEPLQQYLSTEKWYFRDSNWSPDFPTAARQAIRMFTGEVLSIPVEEREFIQEPLSFDGVIAFTPSFVSDLLTFTGPIMIGGQEFSADNILDTLEYQVEVAFRDTGIPYEQRKEIITDLFNEMKTRIFDQPLSRWGPVVDALEENLQEKQIVLFSNSSTEAEEVIRKANWGGVVETGDKDFLMVVDANLASLKTNPQVFRNIKYEITPTTNGRFVGKVTITYDHQGGFDWKTTRYRTYTRIYVPYGSELFNFSGSLADDKIKSPSGVSGTLDVEQELGSTVFGTFISIEPGQSRDLVFEFYLAKPVQTAIESGNYTLVVDKQIGAAENGLTTELNFGKKVRSADPAEPQYLWGDSIYSGSFGLAGDLVINVSVEE
ncbi:MAG: hypothetical protein UX09_C0047G0004 [Candidatus Uhrbacteria bacterium GW2011_GWE2_45_35]|uniref:DUF4012 domain-containing protein n=2 Tax=Candidatus Uhriibacteriota TaxID=1752732 RepID=A0A0G1MBY2_9BACT|nr:MAG: hypothetical protein UW63_C0059G0004 [Candidatus Uhrbacteria bacterium GW2011_GWF2_44_350]KKU06605.1 MAG: hypothetical protein UX09_C0047G0004 [Candidatus Uhrbacteria bacterium GW2011_GWE2_45_35]HBR80031.1 hypothetical protein [Candidatus Uhrbacteria bacterium]HCU31752.1 hypothetical protein [Candidatus Uhrbacteria bacterium]